MTRVRLGDVLGMRVGMGRMLRTRRVGVSYVSRMGMWSRRVGCMGLDCLMLRLGMACRSGMVHVGLCHLLVNHHIVVTVGMLLLRPKLF